VYALLAALVAFFGGCHVIVVGDSNTCRRVSCVGTTETPRLWPERHPLPPPFVLENAGKPGMTAGDHHVCSDEQHAVCVADQDCPRGTRCELQVYGDGTPVGGAWHLDRALERHARELRLACWAPAWLPRAKVVIALGTNDLPFDDTTAADVAGSLLALYDRARGAAPCADLYLATIPPRGGVPPAKITQANAAILIGLSTRAASGRVVPFGLQRGSDLGADAIHMTDAGQERRWEIAFPVLFPGSHREHGS